MRSLLISLRAVILLFELGPLGSYHDFVITIRMLGVLLISLDFVLVKVLFLASLRSLVDGCDHVVAINMFFAVLDC